MYNPNAAEEKAIELLSAAGISDLPVSVEKVAMSLNAEIAYEAYEGDVSGMLYRTEGHDLIGVNSSHPQTRQRFTIAHEIGHLVMHEGTPMFIDRFVRVNWRNGESNQQEVEANSFAAELLMPRSFLVREVEHAISKQANVSPAQLAAMLAKSFDVSAEAMQYRLANLGVLDPYALVG